MTSRFLQSEPGADPIVVEASIAASPEAVFDAWTRPEQVKAWFGPKPYSLAAAEIDLRVGGRWCFVESLEADHTMAFEGEYLAIARPERLAFTWSQVRDTDGRREASPLSRVDVEFARDGEGTRVRVVHSGIPERPARVGFAGGWDRAMGQLVDWAASGSS